MTSTRQRMTSSTQGSPVKEMARIDSTTRIIKRFEAGALLCAMLWQLVSCAGTQPQTDETTTSVSTETDSADNEITESSGVPADLDLDGEVITVWCTTEAYDILALEEQTGDILDDTIYMANTAVQERLNCGIEFVNSGYGSSTDTAAISTLLLADDTTYDLYLPVQWSGGKLVSQGLYLNVADAPYISFDEPWWDLDYMKEMSVGNEKIFTLVGDYSRHRTEMLNCIYYNKQLYEDFMATGTGYIRWFWTANSHLSDTSRSARTSTLTLTTTARSALATVLVPFSAGTDTPWRCYIARSCALPSATKTVYPTLS